MEELRAQQVYVVLVFEFGKRGGTEDIPTNGFIRFSASGGGFIITCWW